MTAPVGNGTALSALKSIIAQYGSLNNVPDPPNGPGLDNLLAQFGLTRQTALQTLNSAGLDASGTVENSLPQGEPSVNVGPFSLTPSTAIGLGNIASAILNGGTKIAGTPKREPANGGDISNLLGGYGKVGSEIAQAGKNILSNITGQPTGGTMPRTQPAWGDGIGDAVGSGISGQRSWGDGVGNAVGSGITGGNGGERTWSQGESPRNVPASTGVGSALGSMGIDVSNSGSGLQQTQTPAFQPAPPLPPEYQFQLNDFNQKANDLTAAAYSPQYQAIKQAQDNVNRNYQIADKIVSGLYSNLADSIGANTTALQGQYKDAQAANTNRVKQTQQNIGDTYSKSQDQLANLVAKLDGGASTGAAVLQPGASDQAYAQSQAALSGQDQADFLQSTGQAANTYQTAQQQAQKTQGVVAQQGLLNDKNNALSAWDQQRLNLAGNQSQQALGLAQQMQGQDLNLQQLNYGVQQDAYKNRLAGTQLTNDQMQTAYQNQLGLASAQGDNAIKQAQLELQARQMAHDMQLDYDKLNQQQQLALLQAASSKYNTDVNADLTQQKINQQAVNDANTLNLNKAKLAQDAQGKPVKRTDPGGIWDQQLTQIAGTGGNANVLKSAVMAVAANNDPTTFKNGVDFANKVKQEIIQQNLNNPGSTVDVNQVYSAALAYWNSIYSATSPR